MRVVVFILNCTSLLLLSAYVTTLVTDTPRVPILVASIVTSSLSFTFELRTWNVFRYAFDTGVLIVASCFSISLLVDTAVQFAVSYLTSSLILFWILVARRGGIVLYNPNTAMFVFTRGSLYATIRCIFVIGCRNLEWLTLSRSHVFILVIPTIETFLMWMCNDGSYNYGHSPTLGATYALLKTCIFSSVPLLDDIIYDFVNSTT